MNVVNISEVRDMLRGMEVMRDRVLKGKAKGFAVTALDWDGTECVYFVGQYRGDKEAACAAALRMSWAMERHSTQPDADLQISRM